MLDDIANAEGLPLYVKAAMNTLGNALTIKPKEEIKTA